MLYSVTLWEGNYRPSCNENTPTTCWPMSTHSSHYYIITLDLSNHGSTTLIFKLTLHLINDNVSWLHPAQLWCGHFDRICSQTERHINWQSSQNSFCDWFPLQWVSRTTYNTHTHTHTQTHTHPQGENTPTSLSCYHSIWEPWPGIIIVACQQLQTVFHFCWPAPPPPHAVKTLILLDPFNTVDTLLNTQNAECIAMRYSIYLWRWKTNIYVCKI